jgi:uncharacterized membrane protein YfcA
MLQLEYWGMIAVFAALWFANMGGISGGGIVVPIAIGFFKFDPKNAIALSNFSICIGSILRFLLNAHKPHPLKNGKGLLVDQNLSIIMLPMIISGVLIGVILNMLMPELVICAAYALLLAYLGFGLFKKGLGLRTKETEDFARKKNEAEIEMSPVPNTLKEGGDDKPDVA